MALGWGDVGAEWASSLSGRCHTGLHLQGALFPAAYVIAFGKKMEKLTAQHPGRGDREGKGLGASSVGAAGCGRHSVLGGN